MSAAVPVEPVTHFQQGDRVAWVIKTPKGVTCGVSHVHRVFGNGMTYCSVVLPGTEAHLPPYPSLPTCSRCDRMHQRASQYIGGTGA